MDIKSCIRKQILAERKKTDSREFDFSNEVIAENVKLIINSLRADPVFASKNNSPEAAQASGELNQYGSLGLYLPVKGEPDLSKIISEDLGAPCLPKLSDGLQMKFVHYTAGALLEKNKKGFLQPLSDIEMKPEIIVAPGLAYSIQGYRLGFGSGYYDRYMAHDKNKRLIIKIGVCFDKYLLESLPVEKHDIKFDYIVTDKIILKL